MAKKKVIETYTSDEELHNVLLAMCRYQLENPKASRPMLVGSTGAGKTERVNRIAEELGMPLKELPLSTSLPEDIGGLPIDNKKEDYYSFKLMEELHNCIEKPHVLFIDETDKVRNDTLGVALKLIWEKKARNAFLHPKTVIICAMQPVNPSIWLADETGQAISARLTFLPVPYNWRYIEDKYNLPLPHLHEREKGKSIALPVTPASPRTLDCLLSFLRSPQGITLSKAERSMVIYGSIAKQDAEVLEASLNQSMAWVDPVEIAKVSPLESIEVLDVHTLTQHIGPLIEVLTPPAWQRVLEKVWIDGSEEDANTFLKNAFEYLKAKCDASPDGHCEIFGTATSEEIVKASNDAATTVAKVWKERNEEKEKKGKKS